MKRLLIISLLPLTLALTGCRSDLLMEKTGRSTRTVRNEMLETVETYLIEAVQKMKRKEPAFHEFQRISDTVIAMRVFWGEVPQEEDYWKDIREITDGITEEMLEGQEPMTCAMLYEFLLLPVSSDAVYEKIQREAGEEEDTSLVVKADEAFQRNYMLRERRAYTYFLMDKPAAAAKQMEILERSLAGLRNPPARLPFLYIQWAYYLHEKGDDRKAGQKLDDARQALALKSEEWPLYYPYTEKDLELVRNCISVLSARIR